jgi:PAS domain S-box-containing protein
MDKYEKQKYILSLLNSKSIQDEFDELDESVNLHEYSVIKKYNQLLKKSRYLESIYRFQSSVIHNLSGGLLVIDKSGNITFSNKAAQDLLEYSYDELNGMAVENLFKMKEDARHFVEVLINFNKKFRNKEYDFVTKSHRIIHIGLSTAHFKDEYNQYEGVIILFKDLTEVKQLKKQIERMDRLALLGELSAGIAHEIRNPLAGIKAAAQILEESLKDNAQYKVLLERIVKEIDKSNKLLKEFFKFAKPSKPKLEFVDIEAVIDGLFLLINPRIKKQGIKTIFHFYDNLPKAYVDETQIEQVFLNIILNALDAMPNGGELKIEVSKHPLDSFEKDEIIEKAVNPRELFYLVVKISDNGVGMGEDVLDKIFDPFYTTKANGLGLGLSICSRLLEENLGKIDAISQKGEGTTFTIMLPCFYHN